MEVHGETGNENMDILLLAAVNEVTITINYIDKFVENGLISTYKALKTLLKMYCPCTMAACQDK